MPYDSGLPSGHLIQDVAHEDYLSPLPFGRTGSKGTVKLAKTRLVVKDPATGRFFRFKEPEYFIAQQLDGSTTLEVIGLFLTPNPKEG